MKIIILTIGFFITFAHAAQISLKDSGDQEFKKGNFTQAFKIYS